MRSFLAICLLSFAVSSVVAAPTNAPAAKKPAPKAVAPAKPVSTNKVATSAKPATNKVTTAASKVVAPAKPGSTNKVVTAAGPDDKAINAIMAKFETAVRTNDFTYAVDVMYAPMLEKMGGKAQVLAAAKATQAQMKTDQIRFISWNPLKPYTYVNGTARRYAVIQYEAVIEGSGQQLKLRSYLLGIKAGKAPWQFVNGDDLSAATYNAYFPDFPKGFPLPKPGVIPL